MDDETVDDCNRDDGDDDVKILLLMSSNKNIINCSNITFPYYISIVSRCFKWLLIYNNKKINLYIKSHNKNI